MQRTEKEKQVLEKIRETGYDPSNSYIANWEEATLEDFESKTDERVETFFKRSRDKYELVTPDNLGNYLVRLVSRQDDYSKVQILFSYGILTISVKSSLVKERR